MKPTPVNLSNSPASAARHMQDAANITLLRCGSVRSTLSMEHRWTSAPYTLVGQSVEAALTIQTEGNRPAHVERGGGYIIPEGISYRSMPDSKQPRRYHWSHLHLRGAANVQLFRLLQSPITLPPNIGQRIGRINLAMTRCLAAGTDIDLLARAAELKQQTARMLGLIIKTCPLRDDAQHTLQGHQRLAPVFTWINDHLGESITKADLADAAGLSASRFHALFLDATGEAPMRYVQQRRVYRAQELLLSTDHAIQQVAGHCGFADPFHFSKVFRQHTRLSPRSYRTQAREAWKTLK